jgi:hypothetical protein
MQSNYDMNKVSTSQQIVKFEEKEIKLKRNLYKLVHMSFTEFLKQNKQE